MHSERAFQGPSARPLVTDGVTSDIEKRPLFCSLQKTKLHCRSLIVINEPIVYVRLGRSPSRISADFDIQLVVVGDSNSSDGRDFVKTNQNLHPHLGNVSSRTCITQTSLIDCYRLLDQQSRRPHGYTKQRKHCQISLGTLTLYLIF